MKNSIKLLSIVICLQLAAKSVLSEPFVVLEYRNNNESSEISDNPFLNNQNQPCSLCGKIPTGDNCDSKKVV